MEHDRIEKIEGSIVQHGKLSNRAYLMKLKGKPQKVIARLDELAASGSYTKIFAKVPQHAAGAFRACGYVEEARIPDFFARSKDCLFMGRFLKPERMVPKNLGKICQVLLKTGEKTNILPRRKSTFPCDIVRAAPQDAAALSRLYREVFESYPFPIKDPEYIRKTMKSHITYYIIRDREHVVAASSAEKDHDLHTVEMTDFATHPEYRGNKFALNLLGFAEDDMRIQKMRLVYTIARALSPGMNIVFARNHYVYGGTLVNNTCICGRIESMNVWYKRL